MSKSSTVEDEIFENINFQENPLELAKYDNCQFIGCQFANSKILDYTFQECQFQDCDLSMIKVGNTAFKDVQFKDCKMLGIQFQECNDFLLQLAFDHCQLDLSAFLGLNLKGISFQNCQLKEVDFSEANLSEGKFSGCDLHRAIFESCNLQKADFRGAVNYAFDPALNRLKKAKFSKDGVMGLLGKYDIIIEA